MATPIRKKGRPSVKAENIKKCEQYLIKLSKCKSLPTTKS